MEGPLSAIRPRNPPASAHDDGDVVIVQGEKREDEDVLQHKTYTSLKAKGWISIEIYLKLG